MSIEQGRGNFPNETVDDNLLRYRNRRELVRDLAAGGLVLVAGVGAATPGVREPVVEFVESMNRGGEQPSGVAKSPQEQAAPPHPTSESEHQSDIAIYENIDPLSLPISDKLFVGRDYLRRDEINDVLEYGSDEDVRETFHTHIDDILTDGRVDLRKAIDAFLHGLEGGLEAFKSVEILNKYPNKASFITAGTSRDNAIAEGIAGLTGAPKTRALNSFLMQFPMGHKSTLSTWYDSGSIEDGNWNDSLLFDYISHREIDRGDFNKEGEYFLNLKVRMTNDIEGVENPPMAVFDEVGTIPLLIDTSNSNSLVGFKTPLELGGPYTVTPLETLARKTGYWVRY